MDAGGLTVAAHQALDVALVRAAVDSYIPGMSFDPNRALGLQVAADRLSAGTTPLPPVRIVELDRVTLGREVEGDDGEKVPAGASGTVVGIWAGGAAFEVEFAEPVSALATVDATAIASHTPR